MECSPTGDRRRPPTLQEGSSVGILVPPPGWGGGFHHEEEHPVPIAEVEKIWMDGELVDWEDAKIHVLCTRCTTAAGSSRDPRVRDRPRAAVGISTSTRAPVPAREDLPHGHPVLE